jgi:hypothetical protein
VWGVWEEREDKEDKEDKGDTFKGMFLRFIQGLEKNRE